MMEVTIKESNGQAPESRAGTARVPQLDLLRSFAVLMVLWYHFSQGKVAGAGWSGVQLFFVLSGFLVSGLLFTEYQTWAVEYPSLRLRDMLAPRRLLTLPTLCVAATPAEVATARADAELILSAEGALHLKPGESG